MIDTVIVSGGNIQNGFALGFLKKLKQCAGNSRINLVAADKGLEWFMKNGLEPDMAVGDFDSLSQEGKRWLETLEHTRILRLKPEKDDSDTQSAMNHAIQWGARDIAILGATGTRLDHVLANLELLILGRQKGARVCIVDENNYITLIESGTVLKKEEQFGRFVSFFSLWGDVEGLTLEGFRYPLLEHYLTAADSGLTVSNEIVEDEARVTYRTGMLMMIMSRD